MSLKVIRPLIYCWRSPISSKILILYEWKSDHKAAVAVRNFNAAFGDDSVNERIFRYWYTKFESGDESLTNEYQDRPEIGTDNEVLRAIVEQNPDNTVRDYAELDITSTTIACRLKMVGNSSHELRIKINK
ncbi:hypothetical protein TNIN_140521 [Trichonephila inaurata madagascariensis]|uniref:Mos1 transposase HTH domain-containing protein n=1 Tax=Trichonephila inaurata madagascariensis TaxID=2747483 RepID=A0A8X7CHT3_9ARAC|nr:hypothetical protein TNIN_140521 [Trichonephila inaurata madagascariensis]